LKSEKTKLNVFLETVVNVHMYIKNTHI